MSFGCLLCDAFGGWLFSIEGLELGGNPFFDEALALCQGLSHAWGRDFRLMKCETEFAELAPTIDKANSDCFEANL